MDEISGFTKCGRYKVFDKVVDGGMGSIHRAKDDKGGLVALKFIHPEYAMNKGLRRRFGREMDCGVELIDSSFFANVFGEVRIRDSLGDDRIGFAMEYLPGEDLFDFLWRVRTLSDEETFKSVGGICLTLDEAHKKGIVHRDVKLENVRLVRDGGLSLLDFGIAKVVGGFGGIRGGFEENYFRSVEKRSNRMRQITRLGTVFGSRDYVSPEVWRGNPADIRSDLYSLGVVLYVAIAGVTPFYTRNTWEARNCHLYRIPVPPNDRSVRKLSPSLLEDVCLKLLSKNPDHRYDSGVEVKVAMAKALKR